MSELDLKQGQWITRGFEAFGRGRFGHGGQNLYASRAGGLQRIHRFDLNRNGHLDPVSCNRHSHGEGVFATVNANPDGAVAGDAPPPVVPRVREVAVHNESGRL